MRKVSDSFLFVLGLVLLALGVPGVLYVVILVLSLPLVRPSNKFRQLSIFVTTVKSPEVVILFAQNNFFPP